MPSTLRLYNVSNILSSCPHSVEDKLDLDIYTCIYEIDTYSFAKTVTKPSIFWFYHAVGKVFQ